MERKTAKRIVLGISGMAGTGGCQSVLSQFKASSTPKNIYNTLCAGAHAYSYGCIIGIATYLIGGIIVDQFFDKKEKKEQEEAKEDDGIKTEDPEEEIFGGDTED